MGFVTASTAPKTNSALEMDVPNYTVPPAGRVLQVCECVSVCEQIVRILFLLQ